MNDRIRSTTDDFGVLPADIPKDEGDCACHLQNGISSFSYCGHP